MVVAPFDVRQTNFIGGGVNAITKSGTNDFKGTAYVYYTNQDLRGNRINGEDLGGRADESKTIYGFTLGGPIVKNKLFFFANYEHETTPFQVIKYRAREDGEAVDGMVSRTLASDMQRVGDHLRNKYGYDPGSYSNFPGDASNNKFLGRLDWNINDFHKLSLRFNHTKNSTWNAPNGNSSDTGYRLNGTSRVGPMSMAFANSMYSMDNKVTSWALDFNSRFTDNLSNQLLFTYTNIEDMRGSNSSPFPFIDIMAGFDDAGNPILEPYMSAGYELFTWNNGVKNKIYNVTDNVTWNIGNHRLMGGISFEHQYANNAYMRNGTGYYRYYSVEDFLNGAAPESFALTYGFNGEKEPNAQVTFNQLGIYLQDEWNISKKFKLTYGVRLDELMFDNSDLARNKAIYALNFGGQHIDTGKWPANRMQVSPRVGFNWDVLGNKSLRVRGGTGIFTGRLPLVFFTNMPTNAGMVQNSVTYKTTYENGVPVGADPNLAKLAGGMITNVDDMIQKFPVPEFVGMSSPWQNAGSMRNIGWELSLNWNDRVGDVSYFVRGNLSDVRNKVLDLYGLEYKSGNKLTTEGHPYGNWYGYIADGFYQSQEDIDNSPVMGDRVNVKPGFVKFRDISGPDGVPDGKIDGNDRTIIGNPSPRYEYGLTFGLDWKGIDFSAFFQGVGKKDVLYTGAGARPFLGNGTVYEYQLDTWSEDNRDAKFPLLLVDNSGGLNNNIASSLWVQSGAYCRLKNIVLGYTLPKKWTKKAMIERVRVYATAQNLFTIRGNNFYEGFDPEGSFGNSASCYPLNKTFLFGLNLDF